MDCVVFKEDIKKKGKTVLSFLTKKITGPIGLGITTESLRKEKNLAQENDSICLFSDGMLTMNNKTRKTNNLFAEGDMVSIEVDYSKRMVKYYITGC